MHGVRRIPTLTAACLSWPNPSCVTLDESECARAFGLVISLASFAFRVIQELQGCYVKTRKPERKYGVTVNKRPQTTEESLQNIIVHNATTGRVKPGVY